MITARRDNVIRTTNAENPLASATEGEDIVSQAELEHVLKTVPKGALVLSGLAVGSLVLAWLAVYFFVFLPRGPIG
jgi:hypothetical protein